MAATRIMRVYRARPRQGKEADYEHFLRTTTLPFLRRQPGLLEAHVGRSRGRWHQDLVVLTLWASEEALQTAAGSNWEEGVVDREHEAPLLEDFTCTHYELLDA